MNALDLAINQGNLPINQSKGLGADPTVGKAVGGTLLWLGNQLFRTCTGRFSIAMLVCLAR